MISEVQIAAMMDSARDSESAGAWDEALEQYELVFRHLPRQGDAATAASLMRRIGRVHRERGDVDLAVEAFEASLAIAEANDLREHVAQALNSLGTAEQFRGRLDTAEPLYVQAREIAAEVGNARLTAMVDQNLGILSNIRGDLASALVRYRSALDRHRSLGDQLTAARTLNNMGMAYVDLEQWEAARQCFEEACQLAAAVGDVAMVGTVDLNYAELFLKRQNFEAARECCDRALEIFRRVKSKWWMAEAYKFYGVLYRDTGRPERADTHFSLALGLAQTSNDVLLEAETQSEWAVLHLEEQREAEALKLLNRAYRLFSQVQARRDVLGVERRLHALKGRYLEVVANWGESMEQGTGASVPGHCRRMAHNTAVLGEAAGFSGWDLTWLRVGASVHDVGKTMVPSQILQKAGPLTVEEGEIVRSHVVVGESMVENLDFPENVLPMVRSHHERWDGTGYPDRRAGEDIPLSARILCVADAFDALTTPRSYRPALSGGRAAQIINQDAGRVYDPEVANLFASLYEQGALAVE